MQRLLALLSAVEELNLYRAKIEELKMLSVDLLVDKYNGDIFRRDYGGWNALGLAVANNKVATIKRLLQISGGV